jgi:hypothetical protein
MRGYSEREREADLVEDVPISGKFVDGLTLRRRFFPESNIGGFSQADAGVALFTQIDAFLRPSDRVLDFGAGRGEHILDNEIEYRRGLFNLRGRCATHLWTMPR